MPDSSLHKKPAEFTGEFLDWAIVGSSLVALSTPTASLSGIAAVCYFRIQNFPKNWCQHLNIQNCTIAFLNFKYGDLQYKRVSYLKTIHESPDNLVLLNLNQGVESSI